MTHLHTKRSGFLVIVISACFLWVGTSCVSLAQNLDDDFSFASGLIDWGFSDFALKFAESILQKHPDAADRVNLIKAQSLIASRKFTEAEEMLAKLGTSNAKADAIRLALANAYNVMGESDKARAIYSDFFSRFTSAPADPDVLRFYQNAAFQYGTMLEKNNDLLGAFNSYDQVLKTNPDKDIKRRVQTEQAQIYLKLAQANHDGKRDEYAFKTRKLIEEIQWGGVDLWFGKSIITLANVELVYNDESKAQKIIKDYMEMLKQIDDLLAENNISKSLSPMAGARFLSGELYQRAADRAASENNEAAAIKEYALALTEYYNVFVQYGESDVGPESGLRAQKIKDVLVGKYGKTVNIDLGEQANKAAATQFRLADTLYREKKYNDAIAEYLRAANQFPENDATIAAMGNLMLSYANMDDTLMVRMLASYIAERLSGKSGAANALLAAGKFYVDKNRTEIYTELYGQYISGFPTHERAGTILFYLAGQRKKAGDEAGAAAYYQQIIDHYPKDTYYPKALSQVAWSFYQAGNYEAAVESFRRLVKESPPNPERAGAQFNLADSLARQDKLAEAAAELETLIGWIAPPGNPYATNAEGEKKNRSVLEKASFLRAQCFARLSEPAAQIPEFREKAVKAYDLFVRMFGESELAPRALSGKGTVFLELKRFDEATKTFDELTARYPQSPEGKNALFSLARAAMEIKQYDQGIAAFRRMMENTAIYPADEFVRLGQLMLDAGFATEAIEAFKVVQNKVGQLPEDQQTAQRPLLERSLFGIAQSYYATNQYTEAIQAVDELMTRYPQSGLFYEAKFLQGEAYRDAGQYNNAVTALSDVFRYASDAALINRANQTLAEVQRLNGDLVEALASYQRIALLTDRTSTENLGLIEVSMFASVEIAGELKKYDQVILACDDYMKLFPQGTYIENVRKLRGEAVLNQAAAPVVGGANP